MKKIMSKVIVAGIIFTIIFGIQSCEKRADDPKTEDAGLKVEVPSSGTFIERMENAKINGKKIVRNIRRLKTQHQNIFKNGRYEIDFEQYVNHKDPSSPTFTQRVHVSLASENSPIVFVTEGYALRDEGEVYGQDDYKDELTEIFRCNQIVVEHRYFGKSVPAACDWNYNTIENQANDLHRINLIFREIFKSQKFISTGHSKGGQTTIYYESYFPEDIDIAVPYVAPICFGLNDMRHAEFLKKVGSPERRNKIKTFQQIMFDQRDKMLPYFKEYGYYKPKDFRADIDIIYDLTVLEYSFMCWQWLSYPTDFIPDANTPDQVKVIHLVAKSPTDYFSIKNQPPFVVNIIKELGYYGYDVTQFTNTHITQQQCDTWVQSIKAAAELESIKFDPAPFHKG